MTPESEPRSIDQRFRRTAAERGTALCVHDERGGLTYAALDRASDGIAAAAARAGIGDGDRVGLLCVNGAEFVIAYLGILKAGATVVPLNLMLNPKEMAYILTDSGARGLIHHQVLDAAAEAALDGLPRVDWRVRIGETPDGRSLDFGALMRTTGPAHSDLDPGRDQDRGEKVAAILYTSGTTGRPKGAMLTHRNLLSNANSVAQALDFNEEDRVLVVLPMFHAFAATVGMLAPLMHGLALVPLARFEPKLVSRAIDEHGASVFLGVPSMYGTLLRLDDAIVAQWGGVRICVSGGAAMPVALMSAFEARFGVPVLEGDGPTECSPVTCVNPVHGVRKPGSVGLPVPGVEMRVLDEAGREVPEGAHGEVCVRGPNVMKGYFGLPDATRESFHGDWFRTGDLGYCDPDGYFFLVDRIKDLIITNGMNVYPRVIEEVLYRHPAIAEAAVVGDPEPLHGEVPVAHVALKPDATATAAEIRGWCRQNLGRHEIPRRVILHAALPRNAAGKILKRELRRGGEHERGVPTA